MSLSKFLMPVRDFPNYTVDIHGHIFNRSGQELKQTINRDGYCMVKLCRDGYEKNCPVHRLVADAFFDGEHDGLDVNHIDGNKKNNFIGNLEWVTRSENLRHAYVINLHRSYLTAEDRKKGAQIHAVQSRRAVRVLETGRVFSSVIECAQVLGCSRSAISRCCRGYARQHHGYHFIFAEEEG